MPNLCGKAITAAHGVDTLEIPSAGGSLPNYVFTKILNLPAFVIPYGNADEANHAPNENLTLECFINGIRTGAATLAYLGAALFSGNDVKKLSHAEL